MQDSFSIEDWERYALCYDFLLHLNPYREMLEVVARRLLALKPQLILDASCGTGNLPITLRDDVSRTGWSLVGVDAAESMLDRARMKCASLHECSFQSVDLNRTLPFHDTTFTQVVSLNTLYAVENPTHTLREFHRVLRCGGQILIVTPRCDYENGMILRAHAKSEKPPSYWEGLHDNPEREERLVREAIQDESVVAALLEVARINRAIAESQSHHFFSTHGLSELITSCGFTIQSCMPVYADQDDFIIAEKRS